MAGIHSDGGGYHLSLPDEFPWSLSALQKAAGKQGFRGFIFTERRNLDALAESSEVYGPLGAWECFDNYSVFRYIAPNSAPLLEFKKAAQYAVQNGFPIILIRDHRSSAIYFRETLQYIVEFYDLK